MKIFKFYNLLLLIGLTLTFNACQDDDQTLGDLNAPSDLNVEFAIVGADDQNPFGNGSGMVNFFATSNNAITYTYDFGDGSNTAIAAGGQTTHQFTTTGINLYTVTVSAVGTGGLTTLDVFQIEVFSSFEDADAVQNLTGGTSKTWYWASDQPAHAGLGPSTEAGGDPEFSFPAWWMIAPNDADKACMYDAEFVFTKTDNGVTFEQTTGPAFVPGTYAGVIGVAGDVCHDESVATNIYGVKNVSFSPSTSSAASAGGYRGTTMSFSDGGFMSWWVGKSEYDIIELTETTLMVRIKEDETFAWYHIFTSVKPG